MERYLLVNLLGMDPRLMKRGFTGPGSHKGWETLFYGIRVIYIILYYIFVMKPYIKKTSFCSAIYTCRLSYQYLGYWNLKIIATQIKLTGPQLRYYRSPSVGGSIVATKKMCMKFLTLSYAYWTVQHLDIWINVDQLGDTCLLLDKYINT